MPNAMTLQSHGRLKAAYETMAHRMRNLRASTEKSIERATSLAVTAGSTGAFAYLNERYGQPPANDPSALAEYQLMGVPADLAFGGVATVAVFLGAAGKYEHLVSSVGNGALGAFTYRFGAETGRKHKAQAGQPGGGGAPAQTKASGAASAWGPRY
jgi:hypothetical protein